MWIGIDSVRLQYHHNTIQFLRRYPISERRLFPFDNFSIPNAYRFQIIICCTKRLDRFQPVARNGEELLLQSCSRIYFAFIGVKPIKIAFIRTGRLINYLLLRLTVFACVYRLRRDLLKFWSFGYNENNLDQQQGKKCSIKRNAKIPFVKLK